MLQLQLLPLAPAHAWTPRMPPGRVSGVLSTDAASAWTRMGFHVDAAGRVALGSGFLVRCASGGGDGDSARSSRVTVADTRDDVGSDMFGLPAWSWTSPPADARAVARVPTFHVAALDASDAWDALGRAGGHPNTAFGVDHVVVLARSRDAFVAAAAAAGLVLKRERKVGEPATQLFYRPGDGAVVEVLASRDALPADAPDVVLWGLTLVVRDIDAAKRLLGDDGASNVRDAVQQGRKILTVRNRKFGARVNLALMTPHVKPAGEGAGERSRGAKL